MDDPGIWPEEFPAAITVTAADGTILAMNARSRETFAKDGGGALIGKNVLDCHPEPGRTKTEALYTTRVANHYTITKAGTKKMIHQIPWYRDGAFAGIVEIAVPIPDTLPNFERD
jgi:transcriptional regulator with PAS, ATPase and Fis domain